MNATDQVRYLERAGFRYKSAESPDLWNFLESHFLGPHSIGPKFSTLSESCVAELIGLGEKALLEAMVVQHKKTGVPGRVARVIDLPYVVGTSPSISLTEIDAKRLLCLVDQPGTAHERILHVMCAAAEAIPATCQATAVGGVYADGRTTGYYDLLPGDQLQSSCVEKKKMEERQAYYATRPEIDSLIRDMECRCEEIAIISRHECLTLINKARETLANY